MDLPQLWKLIRIDLSAARETLPDIAESHRAVIAYHEMLDHNELELACEMLEAYAVDHAVTSAFWIALAEAACKMHLEPKARQFRENAVR